MNLTNLSPSLRFDLNLIAGVSSFTPDVHVVANPSGGESLSLINTAAMPGLSWLALLSLTGLLSLRRRRTIH